MGAFRVRLLGEARDDLRRLEDFLLERELMSRSPDWEVTERALAAIRSAMQFLALSPYTCRKAHLGNGRVRELVIPFGTTGYILRFDIRSPELVLVIGARHQREEDFH